MVPAESAGFRRDGAPGKRWSTPRAGPGGGRSKALESMKQIGRSVLVAAALAGAAGGAVRADSTLDLVRERGAVNCGVANGLAGFSATDASDTWQGFDVAVCRAVAAAVLSDPAAVNFIKTSADTALPIVEAGEVDLVARTDGWSFAAETDHAVTLVGVSYFDRQGFMVKRDLSVGSVMELEDVRVCLIPDTPEARNLEDHFISNGIAFSVTPGESRSGLLRAYLDDACDVLIGQVSALAAQRASLAEPERHVILPETIAKMPMGPVVADGDSNWRLIVRWTLYALILAEELGVTSANIGELAQQGTGSRAINRLLGNEGDLGAGLGLDEQWARRAVAVSGNYGEIFAATIGEQTAIGLARGLNALWTQGGLLYAPPLN